MASNIDEGLFGGNSYDKFKSQVIATLIKRFGIKIPAGMKRAEDWIRDYFVEKYSVWDTVLAMKDNFREYATNESTELDEAVKTLEDAGLVCEVFMKDDRGNVALTDLVQKIIEKAGLVYDNEDAVTSAAYYIADFYSKQSMPINGMVMWGSRDLQKFKRMCDQSIQTANSSEEINACEYKAVTNTRSIMLGNPGRKAQWIEEIKAEYKAASADAAEKRRQAYLASDEHKHMNDPGWRGPNGTWSND